MVWIHHQIVEVVPDGQPCRAGCRDGAQNSEGGRQTADHQRIRPEQLLTPGPVLKNLLEQHPHLCLQLLELLTLLFNPVQDTLRQVRVGQQQPTPQGSAMAGHGLVAGQEVLAVLLQGLNVLPSTLQGPLQTGGCRDHRQQLWLRHHPFTELLQLLLPVVARGKQRLWPARPISSGQADAQAGQHLLHHGQHCG